MSAVDNSLAGLTLDDVLGKAKRAAPPPAQNKAKQAAPPPAQNKAKQSESRPGHNRAKHHDSHKAKQSDPPPSQNRTLPGDASTKDKMSWKLFREKFRLNKAAGAAWTSSIPIPASDVNVQGNRSQGRRISSAEENHADDGGGRASSGKPRPQLARRTSVRFDSHDTGNAHHHSTNDDNDEDNDDESLRGAPLGKERSLSAREAVASQEAAEAAAAAAAFSEQDESEGDEPVKMSLMDLLGEEGSSYMEEDDECYDEDEEEEEEEETVQAKGTEFTCCVCKVDIIISAFLPCEHTYCRLCSKELSVQRGNCPSKELSVQRGNCPLCNGFVFEILQIF